jgi:outer membrane protein TolC
MDREEAYNNIVSANDALSSLILYLFQTGNEVLANQYMQQQKDLRAQMDSLKPEEYEKTYQENIRQISAVENQIIMGSESLYIAVLGLEQSLAEGNRGLGALARSVDEMELRYQLGQVSELNLLALKKTYSETQSQLTSLSTQIRNLKSPAADHGGEDPTGELILLPTPNVTDEMLTAMDSDTGLEAGLEANMDLYWKNKDVEDAQDDWEDASGYSRTMAHHTYQSKVYTYDAARQNFMLTYGNLYRAVFDNQQVLAAAQVSLAYEQKSCDATEKKFELGMISENALSDAKDALASAEDAVTKAETDLYSAYLSYEWATRGIIAG